MAYSSVQHTAPWPTWIPLLWSKRTVRLQDFSWRFFFSMRCRAKFHGRRLLEEMRTRWLLGARLIFPSWLVLTTSSSEHTWTPTHTRSSCFLEENLKKRASLSRGELLSIRLSPRSAKRCGGCCSPQVWTSNAGKCTCCSLHYRQDSIFLTWLALNGD